MKLQVVSKLHYGEETPINAKGCEEIELDIQDIGAMSKDKKIRTIFLGKGLGYRLTLKSFKALKADLINKNMLWRVCS